MKCRISFYKKTAIPLIIGITVFSCTYDKAPLTPICTQIIPDTVSFSKNIVPIFQTFCSTNSQCHSGTHPAGKIDLDASVAYAQLMQPGKGYIDTLNPNYSVLYAQMVSSSTPMPPSGNLNFCTIQLVLKWIQQKAKNN